VLLFTFSHSYLPFSHSHIFHPYSHSHILICILAFSFLLLPCILVCSSLRLHRLGIKEECCCLWQSLPPCDLLIACDCIVYIPMSGSLSIFVVSSPSVTRSGFPYVGRLINSIVTTMLTLSCAPSLHPFPWPCPLAPTSPHPGFQVPSQLSHSYPTFRQYSCLIVSNFPATSVRPPSSLVCNSPHVVREEEWPLICILHVPRHEEDRRRDHSCVLVHILAFLFAFSHSCILAYSHPFLFAFSTSHSCSFVFSCVLFTYIVLASRRSVAAYGSHSAM